jgi:hypothetical protein
MAENKLDQAARCLKPIRKRSLRGLRFPVTEYGPVGRVTGVVRVRKKPKDELPSDILVSLKDALSDSQT